MAGKCASLVACNMIIIAACKSYYICAIGTNVYRFYDANSSVIRQKGEYQNGYCKKTKHAKFSEKRTFFQKCLFFGKLGALCFLVTSV